MLTLSETMRHGYAMAEKYSKAAWRQGGQGRVRRSGGAHRTAPASVV